MNNEFKSISLLGCGWLGLPLAESLVKDGFDVWGSTTTPDKLSVMEAAGVNPVLLDLSSEISLPINHPFFQTDILIISIPPKRKTGSIVNYLLQLKALAKRISEVSYDGIILFSTIGVYSHDIKGQIREEDADTLNELWQAEEIIRSASPEKTTVIRFGGLVGPGRHPGKFLAGKKSIPNGNEPVNLIHQADAMGVVRSVIQNQFWGETINAVAAGHPSRREFYIKASTALGSEAPEFLIENKAIDRIITADQVRKKLRYRFQFDDPFQMIDYCKPLK